MRLTPTVLPPGPLEADPYTVTAVRATSASRAVAAATGMPAVRQLPARRDAEPVEEVVHGERRDDDEWQDRRRLCRRIRNVPVPVDLRSGLDRRREARRREDVPEHVNETA